MLTPRTWSRSHPSGSGRMGTHRGAQGTAAAACRSDTYSIRCTKGSSRLGCTELAKVICWEHLGEGLLQSRRCTSDAHPCQMLAKEASLPWFQLAAPGAGPPALTSPCNFHAQVRATLPSTRPHAAVCQLHAASWAPVDHLARGGVEAVLDGDGAVLGAALMDGAAHAGGQHLQGGAHSRAGTSGTCLGHSKSV